MQRRDFLKTTGTLIAGATLTPSSLAADAVAAKTPADGRIILPINRNWRYSKTPSDAAHAKDFDDSRFEHVVVPHTNVSLPWHSFDEKTL